MVDHQNGREQRFERLLSVAQAQQWLSLHLRKNQLYTFTTERILAWTNFKKNGGPITKKSCVFLRNRKKSGANRHVTMTDFSKLGIL